MIIILNKRFIKLIIALILVIIFTITGIFLFNKRESEVLNKYNYILKEPIDKGDDQSEFIAFTCNVDWGNDVIPEFLEILDEKQVKITFFITGRWAKEFPDLMNMIVKSGHEIGSHGYQHLDYSTLSLDQNKEQIKKADDILTGYTNNKIELFAPPSGAYNENTLIASEQLNYKTILWTIDTIDWRSGSTSNIIIDRVISKDNIKGSIVLMHPMPETVKALPELIDALKNKGVKVGTVSDIMKK